MTVAAVETKPATELWLQTLRFWRCARTIRHGYVDPSDNTRKQLSKTEKLNEIESLVKSGITRKPILKRFDELRGEVTDNKEYKSNDYEQQAKTAS